MKSKKYIYKDLIELTDLLYLVGEAISKNGKEIIFKPSNLTIPRYSILRELSECKDKRLPAASLQKTLKVTSGNITGRLNGLEDMGLIKRVVGKDKRTHIIVLTKKGGNLYQDVTKRYENAISSLYKSFDKDEIIFMISSLQKIMYALEC